MGVGGCGRGTITDFYSGQDVFLLFSGRLGDNNFLKTCRALHLRACLRRIALDVLAAYGACVFEFAHVWGKTFHISRRAAMDFFMILVLIFD